MNALSDFYPKNSVSKGLKLLLGIMVAFVVMIFGCKTNVYAGNNVINGITHVSSSGPFNPTKDHDLYITLDACFENCQIDYSSGTLTIKPKTDSTDDATYTNFLRNDQMACLVADMIVSDSNYSRYPITKFNIIKNGTKSVKVAAINHYDWIKDEWRTEPILIGMFSSEGDPALNPLTSIDLSGLDTSGVTNMNQMFATCGHLTSLNLSNFDTSQVMYMGAMFYNCQSLVSLDLRSFDTTSLERADAMFAYDYFPTDDAAHVHQYMSLTTIAVSDTWDLGSVPAEKSIAMFGDCIYLKGCNGTTYDPSHIDSTYARIDGVGGLHGYLCSEIKNGGSSNSSSSSSKKDDVVDYDTYKSEVPSKTVIASKVVDSSIFDDLKVHPLDTVNTSNQEFLADYYAKKLGGNKAKVILTKGIYPRISLSISEKGEKRTLTWNNLPIKTSGAIYAICYTKENGAYLISGQVDANGTAVFKDYLLNEATNITIFMIQ